MRLSQLPLINRFQSFTKISLFILTLCLGVIPGRAQSGKESQRGFNPGGSYSIGDIETLSMGSGNLMFNVPLVSLPTGRGGSPGLGVRLVYNSKVWDPMVTITPSGPQTDLKFNTEPAWRYAVGYGLQVIDRRNEFYAPYGGPNCDNDYQNFPKVWKLRLTNPDGSKRTFEPLNGTSPQGGFGDRYYDTNPDGSHLYCQDHVGLSATLERSAPTYAPRTYYSNDGTYQRLEIKYDTVSGYPFPLMYWTLYFPDGGRVTTDPAQTGGTNAQRIYDRNNNYTDILSITYNNHPATKIVDQLGRSIIIEKGGAPSTDYIHATGPGNVPVKWTVKWKSTYVNKTYSNGMGQTQTVHLGLAAVDRVIMPTQAGSVAYVFEYNGNATLDDPNPSVGWGEVSAVTLPSGARASYQYNLDNVYNSSPSAVIQNHPVQKELTYSQEYDGASTPVTDTWLYSFSFYADSPSTTGAQVTAPDGGVSSEIFINNSGHWDHGLARVSNNTDGATVERIWQQNIPFDTRAYEANPYVKTEFTSIPNAAGVKSKTLIKDYTYDKNGNVTSVKEYDWVPYSSVPRNYGMVTGIPAGLQPIRVTTNTYYNDTPDASDSTTDDPNVYIKPGGQRLTGAVKSMKIGDGSQTLAHTEFFYDNATTTGNLIQQKSWDSTKGPLPLSTTNLVSVSNQYDAYGNRTLATDANGIQTLYVYDTAGTFPSLYPIQIKAAYTKPVQRTTDLVYDFYTGLVTSSTDADNGVTTSTTYDALGRPTLIQAADGLPEETQTFTTYSDAGRYVITRSDLTAVGDRKLVSIQHYDQLGRVRLSRRLEDSATQSVTNETTGVKVQTRYSVSGSNSYQLVSNPYRAATSADASAEGTMGWTRSKSDRGGRVVEVGSFSGSGLPAPWGTNAGSTGAVTTAYDANATTVTDQAGKLRRSVVDGLGRLVRVDEPNASNSLGSVTAPTLPTDYTFDALGNLKAASQGAQTRTFTYSSLSRLLTALNPEANDQVAAPAPVSYEYDKNGNLTKKTDARGSITNYQYDELNRLEKRWYTGTVATPTVTYTYDDTAVPYSKGKLTSVSSSVSTTNFTAYDALGSVTASSQVTDGVTYSMPEYKYNRAGALTSQTYPSGRVVTNTYDKAGRLLQVSGQKPGATISKPYASLMSYGAHGAVTEMKLGNNLWEHAIFNDRLQPVLIGLGTTQAIPTAQDINRFRVDYYYGGGSNNGNVIHQTISVPDEAGSYVAQMMQVYTYDELNRLKSAVENSGAATVWKQTFKYDRWGNRNFDTANTTSGYVGSNLNYNTTRNQYALGQGDIDYDLAGNLEKDFGGHSFAYDGESRQTKYDGGATIAGGATYSYDGDGRRVKKVVGGVTLKATVFVYDAMGQLVAEYDNFVSQVEGGTNYMTTDLLGSPRVITGRDGGVKARHDYLPFGEEIGTVGGRTEDQKYIVDSVRQKFTGKERDGETGLDYFYARYNSSTQGRFQSADPQNVGADLFDPQSWNGYVYARNNPVIYGDPSGTVFKLCALNGQCSEHTDDQVKAWREQDGVTFKDGQIFNKEGTLIGNYERLSFDEMDDRQNQFMGAMAARAPAVREAIFYLGSRAVLGGLSAAGAPLRLAVAGGEAILALKEVPENSDPAFAAIIETPERETRNGALREAKRAQGVPVTQQPKSIIYPNTPEGAEAQLRPNENVRLYQYENIKGQKVWIREDGAVVYPDGGRQGPHFNSGPAGQKLKTHSFWRRWR